MRIPVALAVLLIAGAAIAAAAAPTATVVTEQADLPRGGYLELEPRCGPGTALTEITGALSQGGRLLALTDVHSHRAATGGVLAQNGTRRGARLTATAQCVAGLRPKRLQRYTLRLRRGRTSTVRAACPPEHVAIAPGYQFQGRAAGDVLRSRPRRTGGAGHEWSVRAVRTGEVTLSVRCVRSAVSTVATPPADVAPGSRTTLAVDCEEGLVPVVSRHALSGPLRLERTQITATGREFTVRNTGAEPGEADVGVLCLAGS